MWKPRSAASGARSNTATATTATASKRPYRGRFAPSPTGLLHLGSLLAAAGSYLRARTEGGQWLLRMEDLDAPRLVPGAAEDILRCLERLGFEWDGPVVRQSTRTAVYAAALERLDAREMLFRCSCSRQELAAGSRIQSADPGEELWYPGTCRTGPRRPAVPLAVRFRSPPGAVSFTDSLQGPQSQDVAAAVGDFVVRRRDGLFAYQLAVVVDDADQGITEVVRGCDLLGNTPRQILLQRALELPTPDYLHLPLLLEPGGAKLAKSRRSVPADVRDPSLLLHQILRLLRQSPPPELAAAPLAELWTWAIDHCRFEPLQGLQGIELESI